MSAKLLNKISDNYHIATAFHREVADAMWFINISGVAELHEYQLIAESQAQRRVTKYIIEVHDEYVQNELPETANIAVPLLEDKTRTILKSKDVIDILSTTFNEYVAWEVKTLAKYQKISTELLNDGSTADFNFVSTIITDVQQELIFATNKLLEYASIDWDLSQIVADQQSLIKRYLRLREQLYVR